MSTTDHVAPDPAQDPAIDRRSRAFLKELNKDSSPFWEGRPRPIHDFALLNALRDVPSTAAALRQAAAELARHLSSRG